MFNKLLVFKRVNMSNQENITKNYIFEFDEMGSSEPPISRSYSDINTPIYCSKELCSKPSLRVDDVINKMIENNLSTQGLFCNGIEDGTRPCGGFFEVNAIGDKN